VDELRGCQLLEKLIILLVLLLNRIFLEVLMLNSSRRIESKRRRLLGNLKINLFLKCGTVLIRSCGWEEDVNTTKSLNYFVNVLRCCRYKH
jgi:hypothetical protein